LGVAVPELPSGTVTFLFTDLEGSTRLWEEHPKAMHDALGQHDELVRSAIETHRGHVVKTTGDGFHAAFSTGEDAVAAAIAAQLALGSASWPIPDGLRARMGIDSGPAESRDGDYYGPVLNRAARLMATAHGGQIVLSLATRELLDVADLERADGSRVDVIDLGEHRLRDLARPVRVFQVEHPALEREFPPLRSLDAFPSNLPIQTTGFVGRERDVEELVAAVTDARVVTLTGVGGVGKTRLALQAAAELLPSFRDGVWFVELAGVTSGDAVQDAVAAGLGFTAAPIAGASGLQESLRAKELLLVLDNCEHLLAAAADLVEQIVRNAPGVHVLVTSREGLGVSGEHLRAVKSLGLPGSDADAESIGVSDAVRLFVERAREASASYEYTDADAASVAELCRRLDGIPLAIELAAARVPALTPGEIATLLDQRFKLLTGGRRAAVSRHHTLRNAIEWSYQLLERDEQVVLDRLAVFSGGFDLPAAQAVAAEDAVDAVDVVDVLGRLVGKSLVVAEPVGQRTRYRLLETVRDFAWERLQDAGDVDAVARRHAVYFAEFARDAGSGLRGAEEAVWRARVEREVDNLRAALAWAVAAADVDLSLGPVSDLAVFGDQVAPYGRAAEDAARLAEDHPLAPVGLAAAAFAAVLQGDINAAVALGAEARERVAGFDRAPESLWVRCRVANATCTIFALRPADFETFSAPWLADARELADAWCLGEALTFVAGSPQIDPAIAAGEEALEIARRLQTPSRVAFAAALLGARVAERDPERAEALFGEARAAAPAAGNEWVDYVTSMALVPFYLTMGNRRAAAEVALASIESSLARGVFGHVMQWVATLASVLATVDDEGALVLSAWSEQRGVTLYDNSLLFNPHGAAALAAIRSSRSAADLERISATAIELTEAGIGRYARERVELLAP